MSRAGGPAAGDPAVGGLAVIDSAPPRVEAAAPTWETGAGQARAQADDHERD